MLSACRQAYKSNSNAYPGFIHSPIKYRGIAKSGHFPMDSVPTMRGGTFIAAAPNLHGVCKGRMEVYI